MPLIVHCPNGCVIRVPRARAGTMVRCTVCKSVIQLRRLTPAESIEGPAIEIQGTLVQLESPEAEPHSALPPQEVEASSPPPESSDSVLDSAGLTPSDPAPPKKVGSFGAEDLNEPAVESPFDPFELPVPQPARLRFARSRRGRGRDRRADSKSAGTDPGRRIDVGLTPTGEDLEFEGIQIDDAGTAIRFDYEFRFLAQFFAMCIGVMGLVLIVPSLLAWSGWAVLPVEPFGSRWIFIMIFLGALHIVYAIFLFQIQDRAALWAVSIFLLLVGCVHGVFTAGTWLDSGSGPISRYLQLPPAETAAVTLWCFLHLCFSILLSYLCGRQAIRWKQRIVKQTVVAGS